MKIRAGTLGTLGAAAFVLAAIGCSASPARTSLPATTSSSAQLGGASATAPTNRAVASTPPTAAVASGCTLPLTQDPYDGFHIGVPSGWDLFTHNGTIVVSRDSTATEESTVTPVLMTTGLTPAAVFSSSLSALQKEIAASGGTMTDTVTSSPDQLPTATLSLQAGQVTMTGQARVVVLPEPTAHGAFVVALLASWAPAARFAADSATLAAIGACYGPRPGTLYRVMKDQVFTYAIPVGWTVASEGQDSLAIADGNDASATYTLTLLPPGSGVDSPQSLLSYVFGKSGIHISQVLGSLQLPSKQVSNRITEGQEYVEFTGTLTDGRAIHGLVYVLSETGGSTPSGVIRLGIATTSLWNSVNGALTHIVNSIQHSFTQDLQQWENLNRQQQAFNQQVQGFDYALNGVDLVHDPTTGANFEAPYDTYRATGPDGPGYYDQANNKLQIDTP
jgi:hypothetical protein